jgi:hypothetical protein
MKEIRAFLDDRVRERQFDDDVDLRFEMERVGAVVLKANRC